MSFFKNTEKALIYKKAIENFREDIFCNSYLSQLFKERAEESVSIYLYQQAKHFINTHHADMTSQDRLELIDAIHEQVLRQNPDFLHPPHIPKP